MTRRMKFVLITDDDAPDGAPRFFLFRSDREDPTDEDRWTLVHLLRRWSRLYRRPMSGFWRSLGWKNPAKQRAGALGGLTAAKEMKHPERQERARRGGVARFYGPNGDLGRASALGRLLRLSRQRPPT